MCAFNDYRIQIYSMFSVAYAVEANGQNSPLIPYPSPPQSFPILPISFPHPLFYLFSHTTHFATSHQKMA